MPRLTLKGYAFEYFVRRMLCVCGFGPVRSDGLLIYDGTAGQMVQGLGQSHNADVLVSPPMQTPFYAPTRLLVECKCYTESLGLSFARNVLGLREDINHFEIVTEEILKNRRSNRTKLPYNYPVERYLYQVALASLTGFKKTTISFAAAHRIPLISFADSKMFSGIRKQLLDFDTIVDEEKIKDMKEVFQTATRMEDFYYQNSYNQVRDNWHMLQCFLEEVEDIAERMKIGLLENGTLLFLLKDANGLHQKREYRDGCTLHWERERKSWELRTGEETYYFELPDAMMEEWKKNAQNWEDEYKVKRGALGLKKGYFAKIVLYGRNDGDKGPEVLHLSKQFLDDAYRKIQEFR